MGIKHIDSIDEKKGTLGILDLMKKGLRLNVWIAA